MPTLASSTRNAISIAQWQPNGLRLMLEIPAQLLLTAGLVASDDASKLSINFVSVEQQGDAVALRSTNGHIAFRCLIPAPLCDIHPDGLPQPLLMPRQALRKSCAKAAWAQIDKDILHLLGSGGGETLELRPIGQFGELRFPDIDAIWPDQSQFSCNTKAPIGVASNYLKLISTAAERLSSNGVLRLETANRSAAPLQFLTTAAIKPIGGGEPIDVQLEFLLMPVMLPR